MLFSAELVDDARRNKALSGELTPISVDRENRTGKFVGSKANVYDTSLDSCTCVDFIVNLGQQKPCKHMIRLAMELGEYPDHGMIFDPFTVNQKYYIGVLRNYIHYAPLAKAVQAVQILNAIEETGSFPNNDALNFAGVPSLVECGLFTTKGKKSKIVPEKQAKKELDGLRHLLTVRLGTLIYDNLSCEPIMTLIRNISILEGDE